MTKMFSLLELPRQIAVGRSARHILEAIDKDRADRG